MTVFNNSFFRYGEIQYMSIFSKINKKGAANIAIVAGLLVTVTVVSTVGADGLKVSTVSGDLENEVYQEVSKAAPSAGASVFTTPTLSAYEETASSDEGLLSAEATASSVTGAFDPAAFGYTNLGI